MYPLLWTVVYTLHYCLKYGVHYNVINPASLPVEIASTQAAAIEYSNKATYDLILMDIGLPDGNGFEATKEIRQSPLLNPDTPIIALTAHLAKSEHEKCFAVGMDEIL